MAGGHTRALKELRHPDAEIFGGKSASLGELIAGEIPVPPGFAVSSAAYREAVREAGAAAGSASRGEAPPLPKALREEIAAGYSALAAAAEDEEPAVAVRSSALGEDAEGATFAGQHETYLWVNGADAVCESVRDCWASLFSDEAVSYRERMSAEGEMPAMGVTVQRMVDAEISGVMFTCNPVSGDPSTVAVDASWGLGLAVVGGEVTPDEYRVSKVTMEVLQRRIGPKQIEVIPDPGGSGTVHAEVAAERQRAACLDDGQLEALTKLARRVEGHFGGHQDIEWAIERGSGDLFLLQSRPVTTVPRKDDGRSEKAGRSAMEMVMGTFGATGTDRS